MFNFWKKEEEIYLKVKEYFDKSDHTRDTFKTAFNALIRQKPDTDYGALVKQVHESEHDADNLKNEIILTLFKKSLIPGTREDVKLLLEAFDEVPNTFHKICSQIYLQRVVFPESLRERLLTLADVNNEAYDYTKEAAMCIFKEDCPLNKIDIIGIKERDSDSRERNLIRDIFSADIPLAEKLLFKQVVISIGNISDNCEKIADIIELAVIKRKV